MGAIFSKSVVDIDEKDLIDLIREEHPESDTVELKEAPPCRNGVDKWYSGGDGIGEYARDQLLAEIVAFANAHGGYLLIGIEESGDHPKRAKSIKTIPRCAELAERLKLQIRDCIEPTIPIVAVRGIQTNDGGDGVVVIRVPQSQVAPHRLKTKNVCYMRHGDRTEAMTMREIQDLTIQRAHTSERIKTLFGDRQNIFRNWIRTLSSPSYVTVGCRVTLIPLSDLYVEKLYQNQVFLPRLHRFFVQYIDNSMLEAFLPKNAFDERPIVRGTTRMDDAQQPSVIQEAHCTGLVEIRFRYSGEGQELYQSWILGALCNGMLSADTFRRAAGVPDIEYAFELEVASTASRVPIAIDGMNKLGETAQDSCLYPRMSLGMFDVEINRLTEIALGDIWNSCGVPFSLSVKSVSWQLA